MTIWLTGHSDHEQCPQEDDGQGNKDDFVPADERAERLVDERCGAVSGDFLHGVVARSRWVVVSAFSESTSIAFEVFADCRGCSCCRMATWPCFLLIDTCGAYVFGLSGWMERQNESFA